ncbi:hypothetical protein HKCCE2091_16640 [Rhodobacterales bacterium HKCCE2091]|nr:hypothetical protein [Rhodobacterales bacterium HKCCE2091]
MSDTDDAKPVAVTYLDAASADLVVDAAKNRVASLGGTDIATSAGILQTLNPLVVTDFAPSQIEDGTLNGWDYVFGNAGLATQASLVIVNKLDTAIRLICNGWDHADRSGYQEFYPASASGISFVDANVIPGKAQGQPPQYAIGIYKFTGRLGVFHRHDIFGTLQFSVDGDTAQIAIGFRVTYDDHCVAVTADFGSHYTSLDDFYSKTVDGANRDLSSSTGPSFDAHASITTWSGVYTGGDDAREQNANQVVTLAVVPKP